MALLQLVPVPLPLARGFTYSRCTLGGRVVKVWLVQRLESPVPQMLRIRTSYSL